MSLILSSNCYGKKGVRIMRVIRDSNWCQVCELTLSAELQLLTADEYTDSDNKDVVATDSMKNAIYVLAKQNNILSPEEFSTILCSHFLDKYAQVKSCCIYAEQVPWERVNLDQSQHPHVFLSESRIKRFCSVYQQRGSSVVISGGMDDMKILKACQSGFVGFVRDEFTTLRENTDRLLCTKVYCKYWFSGEECRQNFNGVWHRVQQCILKSFAGPTLSGAYSSSVQSTLYDAAKLVLTDNPEIDSVELHMPNLHYFPADLTEMGISASNDLLLPTDEPQGIIKAVLSRSDLAFSSEEPPPSQKKDDNNQL